MVTGSIFIFSGFVPSKMFWNEKKIQHMLNWMKAVTKSDCQSKRIRAAVKVNSDCLPAYWCRIWLDHCNPGYDSVDGCVSSSLHHFKQGQSHLVETPFDFDCSGTLLCCILIVQFIYWISGVCVCCERYRASIFLCVIKHLSLPLHLLVPFRNKPTIYCKWVNWNVNSEHLKQQTGTCVGESLEATANTTCCFFSWLCSKEGFIHLRQYETTISISKERSVGEY